jgi:Nucleotidyl transferase AbiEii toxin, Type IV TA system
VLVDDTFALKGGTAINLFVRDMPRLSVDLDLVFPDHMLPRKQALTRISKWTFGYVERYGGELRAGRDESPWPERIEDFVGRHAVYFPRLRGKLGYLKWPQPRFFSPFDLARVCFSC